jgi:uncharacterized damage-inducible protein DinB
MAHILGAKALWLARIQGETPPYAVWPELDAQEAGRALAVTASDWEAFFGGLDEGGLLRGISYRNSQGEPWTSRIGDIVQHVSFHGSHHRGQAALEIRRAGAAPPVTDFIHAARRGLLA